MLILTSAMLSGVHMSTISFLLIWKKVSKVSNIRLGHVASFQPSRSATIQYAISRPFQSLGQRSKIYSTNVADPGSASGGTFQCMQFLPFFIYFSYLSYLGHLSLLGLQTKTRRQRNSSTFCSFKSYNPETFMSSAATAFMHATLKRSQKVPRAKSGTFWFPWMDSHDSRIIQ